MKIVAIAGLKELEGKNKDKYPCILPAENDKVVYYTGSELLRMACEDTKVKGITVSADGELLFKPVLHLDSKPFIEAEEWIDLIKTTLNEQNKVLEKHHFRVAYTNCQLEMTDCAYVDMVLGDMFMEGMYGILRFRVITTSPTPNVVLCELCNLSGKPVYVFDLEKEHLDFLGTHLASYFSF